MTAQKSTVNYHAGLAAEAIVARDYIRRGHRVVHERWRCDAGEIDLIIRDGDGLVFVEVKKSKTHDQALGRVSRHQISRIYTAARVFVESEPRGQLTDMRFDVATVDQAGCLRIFENAFMDM